MTHVPAGTSSGQSSESSRNERTAMAIPPSQCLDPDGPTAAAGNGRLPAGRERIPRSTGTGRDFVRTILRLRAVAGSEHAFERGLREAMDEVSPRLPGRRGRSFPAAGPARGHGRPGRACFLRPGRAFPAGPGWRGAGRAAGPGTLTTGTLTTGTLTTGTLTTGTLTTGTLTMGQGRRGRVIRLERDDPFPNEHTKSPPGRRGRGRQHPGRGPEGRRRSSDASGVPGGNGAIPVGCLG